MPRQILVVLAAFAAGERQRKRSFPGRVSRIRLAPQDREAFESGCVSAACSLAASALRRRPFAPGSHRPSDADTPGRISAGLLGQKTPPNHASHIHPDPKPLEPGGIRKRRSRTFQSPFLHVSCPGPKDGTKSHRTGNDRKRLADTLHGPPFLPGRNLTICPDLSVSRISAPNPIEESGTRNLTLGRLLFSPAR